MRPRLRWTRGRQDEGVGEARTLEWIGCDDAGEAIARVVYVRGPHSGWRRLSAVALDEEAKIVELRPVGPPDGAGWLACVGGQVVGRGVVPLAAVRAAEAALGAGD